MSTMLAPPDPAIWQARREGVARAGDDRSAHEVDYSRIIHSSSFRRLQGKTQILNLGDSDYYRTRLTHSLEVGQIAAGIAGALKARADSADAARMLLPEGTFYQLLGFAHDLGHPPFGHGGEIALNYCLRHHGGFEGNGQTLRILARLEMFSQHNGADLTRRALLGILKYPCRYSRVASPALRPALTRGQRKQGVDTALSKPPKCYLDSEANVVDWVLDPLTGVDRSEFNRHTPPSETAHGKPLHKSIDCAVMECADDIAYGVHDLEDGIALGLITREDVASLDLTPVADWHNARPETKPVSATALMDMLFAGSQPRKRAIGRLVGCFIAAVEMHRQDRFESPLLDWQTSIPEPQRSLLDGLQQVVWQRVIRSANVQHLEYRGQNMVVDVFEALLNMPERLLPDEVREQTGKGDDARVVGDYVSGMTDIYLSKIYSRLFLPDSGSVFDRL